MGKSWSRGWGQPFWGPAALLRTNILHADGFHSIGILFSRGENPPRDVQRPRRFNLKGCRGRAARERERERPMYVYTCRLLYIYIYIYIYVLYIGRDIDIDICVCIQTYVYIPRRFNLKGCRGRAARPSWSWTASASARYNSILYHIKLYYIILYHIIIYCIVL